MTESTEKKTTTRKRAAKKPATKTEKTTIEKVTEKVSDLVNPKPTPKSVIKSIRKAIPKRFNQIELAEEIFNPEIDWLVSISNRTDGKSFNYVNLAVQMAIDLDINFTLISRTFMLRNAYTSFLYKLFEETGRGIEGLLFKRTDDYVMCIYNEKIIGIITDLNNATDLKYSSNFIKDFPFIIYDEFLALEGDYLPDEYDRLKTIYESIDRNGGKIPFIKEPKILLLGNAVNFSSPLLAELDLFNKLETHPINSLKIYDNIALEMRRNENANEARNTRAFKSENDAMTTGQFKINNFKLITKPEYDKISVNGTDFYVKLSDNLYMNIHYYPNADYYTDKPVLSIEAGIHDYLFCMDLKDLKEGVTFLNGFYYSEFMERKYNNGLFLFKNAFSKDYITSNLNVLQINIYKCIGVALSKDKTITKEKPEKLEKVLNDRFLERTKKAIFNRFM